jgi:hypothetical protein
VFICPLTNSTVKMFMCIVNSCTIKWGGFVPSEICLNRRYSVAAQKFNMLNSCDSWSFWSATDADRCKWYATAVMSHHIGDWSVPRGRGSFVTEEWLRSFLVLGETFLIYCSSSVIYGALFPPTCKCQQIWNKSVWLKVFLLHTRALLLTQPRSNQFNHATMKHTASPWTPQFL